MALEQTKAGRPSDSATEVVAEYSASCCGKDDNTP
jgi:hypothetical protein